MNRIPDGPFLMGLMGFLCVFAVAMFCVGICFLLSLQKALSRCSPHNRTIEPERVWWNLVPILNLYWGFHTVINVSSSLQNEFIERDLDRGGDYAKVIGLWSNGLNLIAGFVSFGSNMAQNQAGVFAFYGIELLSTVLFIVYWVRIAAYSRELAADDLRDDRHDADDDANDVHREVHRRRRRELGPQSTDFRRREGDDRYS